MAESDSACTAESLTILELAQKVFPDFQIQAIEGCKEADRFRVPPAGRSKENGPFRITMGSHRNKPGNVHDKPGKNLTRKSTPARVFVTIFGKPWGNHAKLPNQDVSENNPHEHPESDEPNAKRVKHHGDSISHQSLEPILNPQPADGTMTASGDQEPQSSQTPELGQHGPNLKCLNAEQRQQLKRMHVNLGHRTPSS